MAEDQEQASPAENQINPYLDNLRHIAQSHLADIEKDKEAEEEQLSQAEKDIMRYGKLSKKAKGKGEPSPESPPQEKGPKLRPAPDVLDRLRWDPAINLAEYQIGYLERFEGIKEMPATSWIGEYTHEEWIPQHRIKYVKKINTDGTYDIVWDREARIDKIFGRQTEILPESVDGSTTGGVEL